MREINADSDSVDAMSASRAHPKRTARPDLGRRSILGWFLGTAVGALTVSILYPVYRYLAPPRIAEAITNQVDAGTTNDPELLEKNYKIVRFGRDPVILVRVAEGDYRAFSATCTHLDCTVDYRKDRRLIWCWCHNGVYDLHGRNIAGPPPRPLTPYKVNVATRSSDGAEAIIISKA